MSLPWAIPVNDSDILSSIYAPIRAELARVEDVLRSHLLYGQPYFRGLLEHGIQLGGKRLRPAMMLLAGQACGELRPEHFYMGAVVELIHTATLVHDDVLDGAQHRRHLQTINTRWDTETSILLGDYLFTIAIEMTAQLQDAEVSSLVSKAGRKLCEGELRQICERGNFDLSEEDYLQIIEAKTAELYACSAELGAYFAGAEPAVRQALARFGRKVGVAFQIVDDILDVAGDEEIAGKSLGTDLLKRKATLPVIRLLQVTPAADRDALLDELRHPSRENLVKLRQEIARSGAIDYSREKARHFVNEAVEELNPLPENSGVRGLKLLAEYVLSRKR